MAAKVTVGASDYKNHEDGDLIRVNDGHLEVLGRWNGTKHETVALYAPGQ